MKKQTIKAILFDLDGTLADTADAIGAGINRALARMGFPPVSRERVLSFINFGARAYVIGALPPKQAENAALVEEGLRIYNEEYAKTYRLTNAPYPGIDNLLLSLRGKCKMGVLSNKQDAFVRELTTALFPSGTFAATQGFLPELPPKPARPLTDKICLSLGVDNTEAVMVGDSFVDVQTAKNAGMRAVAVDWGYCRAEELRAAGADSICHTPAQLLETLLAVLA